MANLKPDSFRKRLKSYLINEIKVPNELSGLITTDAVSEISHESEAVNLTYMRIWAAVESLYKTGMFPGLSFCLRHQGKIRLNRSIGHLSGNGPNDGIYSPKVKLTPDSPLCMFSASKAVTAMLVHSLVALGEVHLDDPISNYLPRIRRYKSPTVLQVLTHQAGLPRMPLDQGVEIIFDYGAMVDQMLSLKPEWEAGERVGYHAVTGGYLLGEVVRAVTELSIQDYLVETFSKPLGMAYFTYGVNQDLVSSVAQNYFTGLPVTPPFSTVLTNTLGARVEDIVDLSNDPRFQSAIIPSANIMTTAEEAARFYQLLLNDGVWEDTSILDKNTILLAIRPQTRLKIDYMLKVPMRYSAGMMLGESPAGIFGPFTKNAFGHLGFTNNLCWADPDRSLSVGLLTSGKAVIGPHLPKLLKLVVEISKLSR